MPASNALVRIVVPVVLGALFGAGAVEDAGITGDLDAIRSDVARLKANAPSQSHTMSDVGYHWTNLWFAGEKKNWPLATFYFDETRQHILWTIRLRPVRKGADGKDVNLVPIFEGIDTSAFKG